MTRALAALGMLTAAVTAGGCTGCDTSAGASDAGDMRLPMPEWETFGRDDAGHDAGPRDAGAMPELGCFVGRPCDPAVGCNGGQQCQPPIGDYFPGGYCTNAVLGSPQSIEGMPGACNPHADPATPGMDGCLACARCVDLGPSDSSPGAPHLVHCEARCAPNDADNDVCRDGYQCSAVSATCSFPDCLHDDDCQLTRADMDGDGVCDTGAFDPLGGTCDTRTYRCRRPGSPTAHAGDPCTRDSDCEPDGECFEACAYSGFPSGYCTKRYCNLGGRECAGGAKCFGTNDGGSLCLRACTVGAEDASLVLGAGGHGDTCDVGFACIYDDYSPPGAADSGGCLPGNYNSVTTNDVGHACTADSECYSPHGAGACVSLAGMSMCSILGCAGYAASEDVCGAGNTCVVLGDGSSYCAAGP